MLSEQMTGLDIAHSYLDAGLWVLPIKPNKKEPYTALAHRGHLSATNDHRVLDKWINFDPEMNIGIACEMSELVVLDFDFRSMGYEGNNFYSECAYLFYDNTMCVETGNGFHYYFKCSSQLQMKAKVMDGVDIKYRGYVVAPPSMHPNGFIYKSNGKEMMEIPAQLLERMKSNEVR